MKLISLLPEHAEEVNKSCPYNSYKTREYFQRSLKLNHGLGFVDESNNNELVAIITRYLVHNN